jgi:hypothetical protein
MFRYAGRFMLLDYGYLSVKIPAKLQTCSDITDQRRRAVLKGKSGMQRYFFLIFRKMDKQG